MPNVAWVFSASGYRAVEQVFESITSKAARADKATQRNARSSKKAAQETYQGYTTQHKLTLAAARNRERASAREVKAVRDKTRRIERMENRLHAKLTRQRERAAQKEIRAAEKVANARRANGTSALGRGIGTGLRVAAGIGATASAVGGLAVRENLQLQDMATKIAVQGRDVGGKAMSAQSLRQGFEAAASGTPGATATGVAEGVSAIITKTGDIQTALAMQESLATAMVATGARGEDLGKTMADLMQKFDIKSVTGMQQAMADLVAQGKKGSFELEDAARNFAKIGAAAERFGGMRGVGGLKVLGGLTQIARQGTPSGEEAATSVESMFKQLVAKSDMIKKGAGVEVFKDKGKTQARDVQDILVETIGGFEGNLEKLQKVFDVRGIKAVSPLIAEFNRVKNETGSVSEGMASMRAMLKSSIEAGGTWTDVQKDAAIMGKTSSATLTSAWESLKTAVGSELTPVLLSAMKEFAQLEKETGIISKAGAALGTTFTALVEGGEMLADTLKALGILKPKDKGTASQLEATRSLKAADRGLAALDLDAGDRAMVEDINTRFASPEEKMKAAQMAGANVAEHFKLTQQKAAAEGVLYKPAVGVEDPADARAKFLEQYGAASRGKGGFFKGKNAEQMAAELQADPSGSMANAAGMSGVLNSSWGKMLTTAAPLLGSMMTGTTANEGQMKAMQDYASQLTAQKAQLKDASPANELSEVKEAAKAAAAELAKVKPSPTILAGG